MVRFVTRKGFIALAISVVACGTVPFAMLPAKASTRTVVSLSFDDGRASQYATLSMLASHRMTGTYYINSAMVGSSSFYMGWRQIHRLAAAGNEIAGHTLHHRDLTKLTTAKAKVEVCRDRRNLINHGFAPVKSFAYPFAAVNRSVEKIVKDCGYLSGRTVGDLTSTTFAETIPPRNPYFVRTAEPAGNTTTLGDLKGDVTRAEKHGGGWVNIVFHDICQKSCSSPTSLSASTFQAFLDWLQPRSAMGTVVRPVGRVLGVPRPASSHDQIRRDPNDTNGRFDLRVEKVASGHGARDWSNRERVWFCAKMQKVWHPRMLRNTEKRIKFDLDVRGGRRPEYTLRFKDRKGSLWGALRSHASGSIVATFPGYRYARNKGGCVYVKKHFLNPIDHGVMRWNVHTFYRSNQVGSMCRSGCSDRTKTYRHFF